MPGGFVQAFKTSDTGRAARSPGTARRYPTQIAALSHRPSAPGKWVFIQFGSEARTDWIAQDVERVAPQRIFMANSVVEVARLPQGRLHTELLTYKAAAA